MGDIQIIDIICLLVALYGFWQGWNNGIVGTILNLSIYVFGIVLSYKMAPITSTVLERIFDSNHPMMFLAGFGLNLLVIYIMVHLTTNGIEGALHGAYLGTFNRLAGGGVVAMFYILLYSILIWFGVQGKALSEERLARSVTYPVLKELPKQAKQLVIRFRPLAVDIWDDSVNWMDKMQEYGIERTGSDGKVYELPIPEKGEDPFETKPEDAPKRQKKPAEDNGSGIVE